MEVSAEHRGFSNLAALGGALLLLVAHLARAPFHEWWRDEWQTWLTVSASADLSQLLWNTRFDGHPVFWPWLVWLAWRVLPEPWMMQGLHAAIAAAWSFTVLRWAPFPRWASVLVVLGYFPFFEYAVINRNYALGGLLASTACVLMTSARFRPLLFGTVLGLLAWTSVFGVLLSLSLLLVLGAEAAFGARLPALREVPRRRILAALALGVALTGLAILDGLPAAGTGFATGWRTGWDARQAAITARGIFRAFLPVPAPGIHFWNSNWLDGHGRVQPILGITIVGLIWAALRGRPRARLLWITGVAALGGFGYVKGPAFMRHCGFYVLCALCAGWLAAARSEGEPPARPAGWRGPLTAAVLGLHAVVALYASWMDLRHPFSANAAAAAWIASEGLEKLPIVADKDTRVSPLAGLLEKPLFYVRGRRWGTFVIFDQLHARDPTAEEVRACVEQVAAETGGPVLVVLSDPLRVVPPGWRRVAAFGESVVADESYVIYLAEPPDQENGRPLAGPAEGSAPASFYFWAAKPVTT